MAELQITPDMLTRRTTWADLFRPFGAFVARRGKHNSLSRENAICHFNTPSKIDFNLF